MEASTSKSPSKNPFKLEFGELGLKDPGPMPLPPSPESGDSFVVIRSAEELGDYDENNYCSFAEVKKFLSDISIIQEKKDLLLEELAGFEKQMSLKTEKNETTPEQSVQAQADMSASQNTAESAASFKSVTNSLENPGNPPENKEEKNSNSYDMCASTLPALPKPHLEPDENESRAISILSFAPSDFGSEEILQAKITQLIDENTYLKDTLIQNNQSLKSHYERIVLWQQDVQKVHEAHKEKFKEAKMCIETLKEENNSLKQALETAQKATKQAELEAANEKIAELEKCLEKLAAEKDECLAEEAEQMKVTLEKLDRYEKALESAFSKIRGYEKNVEVKSKDEFEQLQVLEEKLLLSEMANERANTEILSLRNQLAKSVRVGDEAAKLELSLKRVEAELESRNGSVMFAQNRIRKLEEDLEIAQNKVKELEENGKFLKEKEEQANIAAWQANQKLNELERARQIALQTQQPTNMAKSQYNPEYNSSELAYIRQQLMQSQKALTDCEQKRAVADAMVAKLTGNVAELQRQLAENKGGEENEFVLRAQLDIYKADFEAEREAKESMKTEKNKLAEDLQHLHRRNQQIQEEIEMLREQVRQHGGRPRPITAARVEPPNMRHNPTYYCPKCNFGFTTVQGIENHVSRCIELDGTLP